MQDDEVIANSRRVAGLALQKLGLQQSVSSFVGSYRATALTNQLLLITVTAPTSGDAVSRANALAAEFLRYLANQLETQQTLVFGALDRQVIQANQQIVRISGQISQLSVQPPSPAKEAKLSRLRAERSRAASALTVLQRTVNGDKADAQGVTASQVKGSYVLDAAAPIPPHSRLKHAVLYAVFGLIAGLVLGLAIVIIRALISERLYRRDDVARALGAPVKLSVGTVRSSSWLPGRRGLAATQTNSVRRIAAYLRSEVPADSRSAALAVVPVGDPRIAALSLVSLAVSSAQEGKQVILVDLVAGTPAARLVGAREPGVHKVRVHDTHLVVAAPGPGDVAPIGPRDPTSRLAHYAQPVELVPAWSSADIILTLAALDPSLGGEHLATWAGDAVVLVTAGRSSWAKIHAVGEMIRLAGMRLASVVLVGADKNDESLGVTHTLDAGHDTDVTEGNLHTSDERPFARRRGNSEVGHSNDR